MHACENCDEQAREMQYVKSGTLLTNSVPYNSALCRATNFQI